MKRMCLLVPVSLLVWTLTGLGFDLFYRLEAHAIQEHVTQLQGQITPAFQKVHLSIPDLPPVHLISFAEQQGWAFYSRWIWPWVAPRLEAKARVRLSWALTEKGVRPMPGSVQGVIVDSRPFHFTEHHGRTFRRHHPSDVISELRRACTQSLVYRSVRFSQLHHHTLSQPLVSLCEASFSGSTEGLGATDYYIQQAQMANQTMSDYLLAFTAEQLLCWE